MAKDYAKFVPSRPRQAKKAGWRKAIVPVFVLLFLLGVITSYFVYQKKSPDAMAANPKVEAFVTKITALLGHHKKDVPGEIKTKPKTPAFAQNDVAPPVQFDFYSELPKLQVTLPEIAAAAAPPRMSKPANNTPATNAAVLSPAAAHPVVVAATTKAELVKPGLAEDSPEPQSVFKPEELEQMLTTDETVASKATPAKIITAKAVTAKTVATKVAITKTASAKADQYLLHLGSFNTQKAAKIWRAALSEVGFQADIAKTNQNGRAVYHVRQGPFANAALAKVSQQKLQKRGITSSIIKKI